MANSATQFKIQAIVDGIQNVEGLKNAVKRLQSTVPAAANDIQQLSEATKKLGSASDLTENALRAQIAVMRDLRGNVQFLGQDYKRLTAEIKAAEQQLARAEGAGGRLKKFGQTAGAIAAGGVFGGPEGLVGGAIGGVFGGPGGALAGAAVGAQVGMLRQQAGQIADYVKQLNLAKVTLAQASTGQKEYDQQLQIARNISKDYSVGLRETILGYSQVAVAAKANGLTLQQTEKVYRGVVSAGVAFGKSQEDLDAIVTATVQVLSKGKVSAEELQGQIGERLPGAVAKFAAATGRSLPELAKALQGGQVSIADFVKFTEKQANDYDQVARIIGSSPEKAGERLKLALDTASENYGGFFQVVGAGLQDNIAQLISWANSNQQQLKTALSYFATFASDVKDVFVNLSKSLIETFGPFFSWLFDKLARGMAAARQLIQNARTPDSIRQEANNLAAKEVPFYDVLGRQNRAQEHINALTKYYGQQTDTRSFDQRAQDMYKKMFGAYQPKMFGGAGLQGQSFDQLGKSDDGSKAARKAQQALEQYQDVLRSANGLLQETSLRIQDVNLGIKSIGLEGRDAIQNKFEQSVFEANRTVANLTKRIDELVVKRDRLDKGVNPKELNDAIAELTQKRARLSNALNAEAQKQRSQDLIDLYKQEGEALKDVTADAWEFARAQQYNSDIMGGLKDGLQGYIEQIGTMREAVSNLAVNAFKGVEDALVSLVTTGKANFQEFARSILEATSRMIIQQLVLKTIMQAIGGIGGGGFFGGGGFTQFNSNAVTNQTGLAFSGISLNANGNVFAANGIQPFAMGGIVNQPTLFKFANGGAGRLGLMGEAGPEAIIPLRRGRDGKLGVAGGGGTNVVVNVDAKGTNVQGDDGRGAALGRVVSQAVQAELIKQRRPGGLLAA